MSPRDIVEALLADGWVREPGEWRPNRLAKGFLCLWVCWEDGEEDSGVSWVIPSSALGCWVDWGVLRDDASCEWENSSAWPGSFHELLDLVASLDRAAMEEPI